MRDFTGFMVMVVKLLKPLNCLFEIRELQDMKKKKKPTGVVN